jgi:hypothetical protein
MSATVELEADELELQQYFRDRDMTDGLPIIVPTKERVDRFLEASGFDPYRDREIGLVAPLNEPVTIEDVAVNAIMAGARPIDLGIVLAAVEAMQDPLFQLNAVQTTTNPVAPFVFVNGPVVQEAELGSGSHALGPGRHNNGPIGRAVRFVLRNLGGANDDVDHASLGQPAKYTCCLAEAEAESPWEPYHVSKGYRPEQSVVTVAGTENVVNVVAITDRHKPMDGPFLHQFGRLMQAIGTNILFSRGSPVIIVTPGQARRLASEGYDRKRLQEALFEGSKVPLEDMPYGNYAASAKWTVVDGKVLTCPDADDVRIIVAGGGEGLHSVLMQGVFDNIACSREVWSPERLAAEGADGGH